MKQPSTTLTDNEITTQYFQAVNYERAALDAAKIAETGDLAWEWRMIAQRWEHEADRLMSLGVSR